MRSLIISDIHGNWEALQAVAAHERADRILCLGDIVDYGPRPAEVVRWVRDHADVAIRGNHDTAVALGVSCRSAPSFRRLSEETRKLTTPLLATDEKRFLAELPLTASIEIDGVRVLLIHAAPADPLYQYLPASDTEGWRQAVQDLEADIVLVGHTHLPAFLNFGDKFVVNPGSVGLPRDGDPRASYAVLERCNVELKRVTYEVERTIEALREWGAPVDVVTALEALYRGESTAPITSGVQA